MTSGACDARWWHATLPGLASSGCVNAEQRAGSVLVILVAAAVLAACQPSDRSGATTPRPATSVPATPGSSSPALVERIEWSVNLEGDSTEVAPGFAAGVVFVATHHGKLAALDARSGAVRWRGDLGELSHAIAVAGSVYTSSARMLITTHCVGCAPLMLRAGPASGRGRLAIVARFRPAWWITEVSI